MMKTVYSCYQQNITEPLPLSTLPPPSSSSSSSSPLFPSGPGQDSADDSTVGVHVSHARCSRTTRCHCAQVHPVQLDVRVQEMVSEDHHHLPHWHRRGEGGLCHGLSYSSGGVVSWPVVFFRVGGAWPVVFFRVGGA